MYIYPFTMEVDPIDRRGSLKKLGQTKSILEPTTVFSQFEITQRFLVASCSTCNGGLGWVRVYNPDTVVMLFVQLGEQGHEETGNDIGILDNLGNSELIYYSSRVRKYLKFNSLLAF